MTNVQTSLQAKLAQADWSSYVVVAGFDGFVDELIHVVDQRSSLDQYTPVPTITQFSELMAAASGRSSLREIVVSSQDAGGCAVNLGDGVAAVGVPLHLFATLGQPRHAAFNDMAEHCQVLESWGEEPGRTLALEFQDGKYMLSAVDQLKDFTPSLLQNIIPQSQYLASCQQAQAIALTNWTLYPHMTECWNWLQQDIYSQLTHRPRFMIDLVDPRSRSAQDMSAMIDSLRQFEQYGPTTFACNVNEANAIAELCGFASCTDEHPELVVEQAQRLRSSLGIDEVAIHCIKCAATAASDGTAVTAGPYTATPKNPRVPGIVTMLVSSSGIYCR